MLYTYANICIRISLFLVFAEVIRTLSKMFKDFIIQKKHNYDKWNYDINVMLKEENRPS